MLTRSLFCMKRARRAKIVGSKISAVASFSCGIALLGTAVCGLRFRELSFKTPGSRR